MGSSALNMFKGGQLVTAHLCRDDVQPSVATGYFFCLTVADGWFSLIVQWP